MRHHFRKFSNPFWVPLDSIFWRLQGIDFQNQKSLKPRKIFRIFTVYEEWGLLLAAFTIFSLIKMRCQSYQQLCLWVFTMPFQSSFAINIISAKQTYLYLKFSQYITKYITDLIHKTMVLQSTRLPSWVANASDQMK